MLAVASFPCPHYRTIVRMGRERAHHDATKVAPTLSRYTRLAALKAAALGLRRDVLVEVLLELVRALGERCRGTRYGGSCSRKALSSAPRRRTRAFVVCTETSPSGNRERAPPRQRHRTRCHGHSDSADVVAVPLAVACAFNRVFQRGARRLGFKRFERAGVVWSRRGGTQNAHADEGGRNAPSPVRAPASCGDRFRPRSPESEDSRTSVWLCVEHAWCSAMSREVTYSGRKPETKGSRPGSRDHHPVDKRSYPQARCERQLLRPHIQLESGQTAKTHCGTRASCASTAA
jgi:hypothetical protein